MEAIHLSKLLERLAEQAYSSSHKKIFIQTAAANNSFTCDQVVQILDNLSLEKDKLEMLKILRSRISDIESLFQIMDVFTFAKDQKKAGALLGQPENVETAIPRITDSAQKKSSQEPKKPLVMKQLFFVKLLESLDKQNFSKDMFYLVELAAFRNAFTSEQVVSIIKKFQFPRHQLKILNILRYRIIDPENYFLLLSTFAHSSDKKKANAQLKEL